MKNKLKLLYYKIKSFFFPREPYFDLEEILNPPSWRERQIQNKLIEKQYEESVMAKQKTAHWSDKYDKDFENINKEAIRVRGNHD